MSSLFNQTNISPGTAFGGSSNFSAGITLNGISLGGSGAGNPLIIQPSNQLFLGDGAGLTGFYGVSSIAYATVPAGVTPALNLNIGGISSIQLNNLSSLQAGAFTVNAPLMFSTMKGYGWA